LRGDLSSIDIFKPFDLIGLETDKIAVNLFNLSLLEEILVSSSWEVKGP